MKKNDNNWPNKIINFLGWLILLLGIYATIKTSFNFIYFKNKYPTDPVLGPNFSYPKYEEECYEQFNYPLYNEKGLPREPDKAEEKIRRENIKNCLKKIEKNRELTKQNDIWTSFMLIFIGAGILVTKRFYLK
ncbi:MAG: hypothetical protein Fur009_1230 [Candidatus Microgenomates bacterium]